MAPSDANFAFSGVPGGRAVPVSGGFELSGTWPLVSGCADAEWALLNGIVDRSEAPDQKRPEIRHFLVQIGELEIQDNWQQVAGMRGTGSNGVTADRVFVPEELAQTPTAPIVLDRPLYRLPVLVHAVATSAAAVLGAWRSGAECIVDTIATYRSAVDGSSPGDDEYNQELAARADATLRAARAGFARAVDELWAASQERSEIPKEIRGRMYATATYILDTARESISRLYAASSRATFEYGHPAEQALRNIHAFSNPIDRFRRFSVDAGRVILGREPRSPLSKLRWLADGSRLRAHQILRARPSGGMESRSPVQSVVDNGVYVTSHLGPAGVPGDHMTWRASPGHWRAPIFEYRRRGSRGCRAGERPPATSRMVVEQSRALKTSVRLRLGTAEEQASAFEEAAHTCDRPDHPERA